MEEHAHAGTRRRILEVAEFLLAERGYAGTKLHEIAQRVGVQKASLFHHFPSKEDLYHAVLEEGVHETERLIRETLECEGPPFERMCALIEAYVDVVSAHPARATILLRQSFGESPVGAWAGDTQRLMRTIIAYVEKFQAARIFTPVDVEALVIGIAGATVFFFTAAPVVAPTSFADPTSPASIARIKAHLVDMLRRCVVEKTATVSTPA